MMDGSIEVASNGDFQLPAVDSFFSIAVDGVTDGVWCWWKRLHHQASLIWGFPILPILSSYGEKKN